MKEIPFFDQILTYKKIDSTFTRARQLIVNKVVRGNFLLVAETQSTGKGRKENRWFSPPGGLWFTAGFFNLPLKSSLTIYMAITIVQAINKLYPDTTAHLTIKWPNDLFLNGQKIGGILTSAFPDLNYILSGTGLNTNNKEFPEELREHSASLSIFLQREIDNEELLLEIFQSFLAGLPDYLENELENLKTIFNSKYSYLTDKKIVLQTEFDELTGLVKGINREGALILLLKNGSYLPIYSGTVTGIGDKIIS